MARRLPATVKSSIFGTTDANGGDDFALQMGALGTIIGAMFPRACAISIAVLVAGCGGFEPGNSEPVDFSFEVDQFGDFEAGVFEATEHDGVGIVPTDADGGRWISAVFDSGQEGSTWSQLEWAPTAPYGKPLPNLGGSESGYSSGNVNMGNNVLLVHCDGESTPVTMDESGSGHRVTAVDGAELAYEPGLVGTACRMGVGNHFRVPFGESNLVPGEADYTWSAWVKTNTPCENNDVFIGADADDAPQTGTQQWLGCSRDDGFNVPPCDSNDPTGYLAGLHRGVQAEVGGAVCTRAIVNDDRWHHVAISKSGFPAYTLRFFFDGAVVDTSTGMSEGPFSYDPDDEILFGSFPRSGFDTEGESVIDEIALFSRALTEQELIDIFRRGASSITLQVRSCDDPDCSGEEFTDASGTVDGVISDPAGTLGPPEPVELNIAPGRYFQFRVTIRRESVTALPRFEDAVISGSRR